MMDEEQIIQLRKDTQSEHDYQQNQFRKEQMKEAFSHNAKVRQKLMLEENAKLQVIDLILNTNVENKIDPNDPELFSNGFKLF